MIAPLTSRQKWQLAFRLLLLYSPLILYVKVPEAAWREVSVLYMLPLFGLFSAVALGMYFVWITATDWIQRKLFERYGETFLQEFNWKALAMTVLIALGLAVLYILVLQQIIRGIGFVFYQGPGPPPARPELKEFPAEAIAYFRRANNGLSVSIMLSAFYLTINARSYQQLRHAQLKAERLEKEAAVSQFEALKSQVSPHFLFNSLSILTSLVHEDANLSEQFIKHLSKAYRYILEQRDQDLVPLKTELEFIQAYTFLLQIRFENKFSVTIEVPEDVQQRRKIAPLSLQMLVENVVKHNRMSVREPLWVRIYAENDRLRIENPLQPRSQPEVSTGVGLRNITNRYALLTERPVRFGAQAAVFGVELPLL